MKAIVSTKYGQPELLTLTDQPKPTPKGHEVLVRIHATAINDYDWSMVRGKPYIYRLMFGLFKPKYPIPGMELAGTIEAVGENVESLAVGDEVYGDTSEYGFGTFAEYISIHEKALVKKPASMSFEEATTISHAAMLAYQGLIDIGGIQEGFKLLINGAGGGMGTFGFQIAKQFNPSEITGVDTGEKLQMMKSIGFDHIIDYKQTDFTKNGQTYDLILDAKTNRSPFRYSRALKPGGKYVTVGGSLIRMIQLLLFKGLISRFSKKHLSIVALKANKDLKHVNELFDQGKIKAIIDGPFSLEEVPKAIKYFGEGKHTGKVVIKVSD